MAYTYDTATNRIILPRGDTASINLNISGSAVVDGDAVVWGLYSRIDGRWVSRRTAVITGGNATIRIRNSDTRSLLYGTPYADKAAFRAIYYTGHLNAVGYKYLATRIMTYIDWVISHDTQRFGQAAFIQTEYSYNVTPVITISGQPNDMTATEGAITGGLNVTATVTSGNIAYQWYSNNSDSNTGGTLISGATGATMALDDALTEGSYYYYCILSCEGATNAVSNCATVSVAASGGGTPGGGTPANTVLASYTLSGTANGAAPATLADASGNSNTLTVNGVTAYNADGYLPFNASGESLSASSFSLGNASSVALHMEMYTPSGITRQQRFLYINGIDLHFMFASTIEGGTPVNLRIETGATALFVADERIGGTANSQGYVAEFREATLDITLTDAQITVVEAVKVSTGDVFTETHTVSYSGALTAFRTNGAYFMNRPDGARPMGMALSGLSISAA